MNEIKEQLYRAEKRHGEIMHTGRMWIMSGTPIRDFEYPFVWPWDKEGNKAKKEALEKWKKEYADMWKELIDERLEVEAHINGLREKIGWKY